MKQRIEFVSKLMLPGLFLCYAAFANVSMLVDGEFSGVKTADQPLLAGGLTKGVDKVYKDNLPHMTPAIGLLGAVRYQLLGIGKPGVVVGKDEWFFTKEEFAPKTNAPSQIDRAIREIEAVKDELDGAGIKLVVVPLPYKTDIYADVLNKRVSSQEATLHYRNFIDRLAGAEIPFIDTRDSLIKARVQGEVFFKTDTHWTPLGAESVARQIAGSVPLPEGIEPSDFELIAAKHRTFWGDLVRFVTNEDFGEWAGLNKESATLWQAEQTMPQQAVLDLFASDDAFPVILVGTSYSANPNWSFAEFLKHHMKVDIINHAKEGQGPGTPMYDYLKSDDFQQTPPRLVIWEIPTRYIAQDDIWAQAPKKAAPQTQPSATAKHATGGKDDVS